MAEIGSDAQRWWARAVFVFFVGAAAAPVLLAGAFGTVALLVVGTGGVVITVAALYWFLTRRGTLRWISMAVAIAAPIVVLVLFIRAHLLWVVLLSCACALLAVVCARAALRSRTADRSMPEYSASPSHHPFVIMNPHSGGGKVAKFGLKHKAEELGAEVVLLDGPDLVDVVALARQAVLDGADLLGVAGGDGTQALVAAVAAENDLPFLVISAGTRNHFAMDLGLDRDDPTRSLDALSDGVELRVDLGTINGRPFVNNASFGVYAEIVRRPDYRDDKTATMLEVFPDLLTGHAGPRLEAQIGDSVMTEPQAVLVSNNAYGAGDLAGLSRRSRLDRGVLGAITVSVANTRQAVGLLRRTRTSGLTQQTASEVVVRADAPDIPVGVDGESLVLRTPVRCSIEPKALRVRVPRNRPGVRTAAPTFDWVQLRRLAFRSHSAPGSTTPN
ncbi:MULTISPECIES: diacylglycerol kinase family protein [unclassified Rhodococcus (in: high G+C Gram-positive bacteria)]|uniref:diacylglycerol/lipid kinase family protein n=1 Tax=unclassified Rhodococcus (in: high G+C Gram-positive bacteria) TaxID=192944 RepID=UPI001FF8AA54|nr:MULTISPECIES: diacylglycerol kinase family protein [unclassified Rhodococcus (in: high G+C Gram-positive bacteria)]